MNGKKQLSDHSSHATSLQAFEGPPTELEMLSFEIYLNTQRSAELTRRSACGLCKYRERGVIY